MYSGCKKGIFLVLVFAINWLFFKKKICNANYQRAFIFTCFFQSTQALLFPIPGNETLNVGIANNQPLKNYVFHDYRRFGVIENLNDTNLNKIL